MAILSHHVPQMSLLPWARQWDTEERECRKWRPYICKYAKNLPIGSQPVWSSSDETGWEAQLNQSRISVANPLKDICRLLIAGLGCSQLRAPFPPQERICAVLSKGLSKVCFLKTMVNTHNGPDMEAINFWGFLV